MNGLLVAVLLLVGALGGFGWAMISEPTSPNPCLTARPGDQFDLPKGILICR
jgi:hypothetical protein